MEPDLALVNGRFHTMDPALPEARAAAIRAGRFLAVGDEASVLEAVGTHSGGRPTLRVDLGGRCVLPGLTDSHIHCKWFAESLRAVDVETATLDEAVARVRARAEASEPGAWITGTGWNHNMWGSEALPDRGPLDRAAPRNPVALKAKSGHAMWVNTLALEKAGIGRGTADPAGGRIVRTGDGVASGILLEKAMEIVFARIPKPTPRELAGLMRDAQAAAHRVGLTGIHDFDSSLALAALLEMEAGGELVLRVVKGIPHDLLSEAIAMGLRTGFGGEHLTLGPVKLFADGALGPQTAWMLEPYEGTRLTGIPTLTEERLFVDIRRANAAGLACAVHAIGDAACRAVLNAFEKAAGEAGSGAGGAAGAPGGERPRLRNRIEHVQLIHRQDLPRLARLGVVASMQPLHATSDMAMAERHWGERCSGAYAWRALLEAGTRLAFGSDCPVEIPDPLAGIHAAVTRRRADGSPGPDGWRPGERLSVGEAVAAYTIGAAFAGGREGELGSISVGKRADLTVLERDIFSIDAHEIRGAGVSATMVGGRFVHRTF